MMSGYILLKLFIFLFQFEQFGFHWMHKYRRAEWLLSLPLALPLHSG